MSGFIQARPTQTPSFAAIPSCVRESMPAELKRQGIEVVGVYGGTRQIIGKVGGGDFSRYYHDIDDIPGATRLFLIEAYAETEDLRALARQMNIPPEHEEKPMWLERTPYDEARAAYQDFYECASELDASIREGNDARAQAERESLKAERAKANVAMDRGVAYCKKERDADKLENLESYKRFIDEVAETFLSGCATNSESAERE